jgi:hypothetical protein
MEEVTLSMEEVTLSPSNAGSDGSSPLIQHCGWRHTQKVRERKKRQIGKEKVRLVLMASSYADVPKEPMRNILVLVSECGTHTI